MVNCNSHTLHDTIHSRYSAFTQHASISKPHYQRKPWTIRECCQSAPIYSRSTVRHPKRCHIRFLRHFEVSSTTLKLGIFSRAFWTQCLFDCSTQLIYKVFQSIFKHLLEHTNYFYSCVKISMASWTS